MAAGRAAESSGSEAENVPVRKPTVFSRMQLSDESSSSSSEEDVVVKPVKTEEAARVQAPVVAVKVAKLPQKKQSKKTKPVEQKSIESAMDPLLNIDVKKLNPASELRRILGSSAGRMQASNKRVVGRKHWLVGPEKDWPLVVHDAFRMELCLDGSHCLVPEAPYESKLRVLSRIVLTHDIEALYQFVQLNPFHPHGLVQLACVLIEQQKEYENAQHLIRRALFSIQSSFAPSFHPGRSLVLSRDSVFSSVLLRAMVLYAHLLAGQGCTRTSFEVLKVVYAMEGGMLTGCPSTHALLHLDAAALKAEQWDFLSIFFASHNLTDVFPGTGLLFAVAQKLRGIDAEVSMKDVKQSVTEKTPASTALVRTLLMFPGCAKLIVNRDIPGIQRRPDILVNKLIQAFAAKGVALVKSREEIVAWINRVVDEEVPKMVANGLKGIPPRTPQWLTEGYSNIISAEFEWGKAASFVEPRPLLEAEAQVLELYNDDEFAPARNPSSGSTATTQPVSLESNPVAAFFQTLLPWSRVDVTGTESTPVTARGLLEQLQASLRMNPRTPTEEAHPLIQERRGSESASEQSDELEEEVEME